MAIRLSRRRIAAHAADRLLAGESHSTILRDIAAYLVETRRTRERELLVRDIEEALAARGSIIADVASASPLTDALKKQIMQLVGGTSLQLREVVDPTLLGGVRVDIPGKRFDGTMRRKLTALRAKQL
jgi:F-type H+-transporting ATPase subunit delta